MFIETTHNKYSVEYILEFKNISMDLKLFKHKFVLGYVQVAHSANLNSLFHAWQAHDTYISRTPN